MPCVVAADGDRDSMPVVVKEALAMELPVVASDEVGLPGDGASRSGAGWSRPATPRRSPRRSPSCSRCRPSERAAMGRAGRAFVLEHCDVDREAERLAELISSIGVR